MSVPEGLLLTPERGGRPVAVSAFVRTNEYGTLVWTTNSELSKPEMQAEAIARIELHMRVLQEQTLQSGV